MKSATAIGQNATEMAKKLGTGKVQTPSTSTRRATRKHILLHLKLERVVVLKI